MSALDTKEDTLLEKRTKLARQLASLNKKAHQLKSSYLSITEEKKSVRFQIQELAKEEAQLQKRKKKLQKAVQEVSNKQKSFAQKKQLLHLQHTQVVQAIAKVDHRIRTEQEARKKQEQELLIKKQQEQEAKRRRQQEATDVGKKQTSVDDLEFDLETYLIDEAGPLTPQQIDQQNKTKKADAIRNNDLSLDVSNLDNESEEIEIEIDNDQIDVDLDGFDDEQEIIEFDIDIEEDETSNREVSRTAINVDVNLHTESNFFTGLTENLSEGGLFVASYDLLDVGTLVDLVINLPNQQPIKTQCIVCWTRELDILNSDLSPGMGLQFRNLGENQKKQIRDFLELRDPIFIDGI